MLEEYFADLHIHIGSGKNGEPVKITASRRLNFANIAKEAAEKKGLDIVGIIDAASPVVLKDIEDMLVKGEMVELPEGGFSYQNKLVIIPGAEVESREENGGQAHYLAFFPHLNEIREFSEIMKQYITNINLSSQAARLNGSELLQLVTSTGGILIPAHAFTPHKSFYGRSFKSYGEVFSPEEWEEIPAVELGLSADSFMADYLPELGQKVFLSNSDAHSLGKIAREYNKVLMADLNYKELVKALRREDGRRITANYGLDPRLGKYHRSYCTVCEKSFYDRDPVIRCPLCSGENIVMGVKDRLLMISPEGRSNSPDWRPPYIHQIPLNDVPGIGPKTMERLLEEFGTEMDVLHSVNVEEITRCIGERMAAGIDRARSGRAEIKPGGGGIYGKVMG